MAWNTHPTVNDGDGWSASDQNTYVKGNLDTLFPYSAAQQVAYSTSTTSLNKATAAAAGVFLRSNINNTAIEFGAMVYKRQGNSTNWFSTSTSTSLTNYTPANSIFQSGNFSISTGSTYTVTYPQVYTVPPLVFIQVRGDSLAYFSVSSISTASFNVIGSTSAPSYPEFISWFSVGEV